MARWQRGQADIEGLLASAEPELELVTGAAADGTRLLAQASATISTAESLVDADAYSAYVLAYDAARFACIALLAQQGLCGMPDEPVLLGRQAHGKTGILGGSHAHSVCLVGVRVKRLRRVDPHRRYASLSVSCGADGTSAIHPLWSLRRSAARSAQPQDPSEYCNTGIRLAHPGGLRAKACLSPTYSHRLDPEDICAQID